MVELLRAGLLVDVDVEVRSWTTVQSIVSLPSPAMAEATVAI
ncbi:hypothetical protein [Streptomyces sp. NPDC127105]